MKMKLLNRSPMLLLKSHSTTVSLSAQRDADLSHISTGPVPPTMPLHIFLVLLPSSLS